MGSSESESEDERRVVRSAKVKAQEELAATCNEVGACRVGFRGSVQQTPGLVGRSRHCGRGAWQAR